MKKSIYEDVIDFNKKTTNELLAEWYDKNFHKKDESANNTNIQDGNINHNNEKVKKLVKEK